MASSSNGIFDGAIFQSFIWPFKTAIIAICIAAIALLWTIVVQSWFANSRYPDAPLDRLVAIMEADMEAAAEMTPLFFSPTEAAWGLGTLIRENGFGFVLDSARMVMNTPKLGAKPTEGESDLGKTYIDTKLLPEHGDKIKQWIVAAYIFSARISVYMAVLPLLVLLYAVSVVDGLARRAVRRANAERESASIYHRAKLGQIWLIAVSFIGFLTVPTAIHPAMLLIPLAVLLAYLVRTQMATYKKYM